MAPMQHKMVRDPVQLQEFHSSGRCMGLVCGKKVYLEGAIPGETVTYTLGRRNQGFRAGRVEEILHPSPFRVRPFCKHVDTCGGCPWQHMDYRGQLRYKREILCNALAKYGISTPEVPQVVPSPENRFYRHRMEYAFAENAWHQQDSMTVRKRGIGFHMAGDPGNVFAVEECFLQAEPSRSICAFIENYPTLHEMDMFHTESQEGLVRSLSIRVNLSGDTMVTLGMAGTMTEPVHRMLHALQSAFPCIVSLNYTSHLSRAHSQMQGEIQPFDNSSVYLHERIGDLCFRIHASSFFQPNVRQAEAIFKTVCDWARLTGTERVYDLYTGVGTLALFLARSAARVTGIEGSAQAISDARENALRNGISNTEFLVGDILETFRPSFVETHGIPDLIVLDPPRSGTLIEIKKTINTSGANKVIYLSCNPVSLAFDLKQLTEAYQVTRILPFDMLPQTHHLETLVLLEKK